MFTELLAEEFGGGGVDEEEVVPLEAVGLRVVSV